MLLSRLSRASLLVGSTKALESPSTAAPNSSGKNVYGAKILYLAKEELLEWPLSQHSKAEFETLTLFFDKDVFQVFGLMCSSIASTAGLPIVPLFRVFHHV